MVDSYFKIFALVVLLTMRSEMTVLLGSELRCPPCTWKREHDGDGRDDGMMKFAKKVSRFWEFKEESNRWEEITLPFQLQSSVCVDEGGTTCSSSVGITIKRSESKPDQILIVPTSIKHHEKEEEEEEEEEDTAEKYCFLPLRKRVSVTKMSGSSVWVTGPSGSIYERFWNGVRWVMAPHEPPILSARSAVSIFLVNQTVLALSEAGALYELQLNESEQFWVEAKLIKEETEQVDDDASHGSSETIKFLGISKNGEKLYFSSKSGMLVEITELHPLRWTNYGRPPGAEVHSIADVDGLRPGVVFTISSTGELFEFDKNSKPSWRKHIWNHTKPKEIQLATSKECCSFSLVGAYSQSLFLLSKDGCLLERQLQQRKWKWVVHKAPQGHHLSSITTVEQDEVNENFISMFFTTSTGSVLEYQLPKHSGFGQENQVPGKWVDHGHPEHAKVARGVSGTQLHFGRMIFPLDDGRLAELHLPSVGGEDVGPPHQISTRRRATSNYEWSILDAPETEGWNAEYCSLKIGPTNCIAGAKVTIGDGEWDAPGLGRRRAGGWGHRNYLPAVGTNRNQARGSSDESNLSATVRSNGIVNFRMRALRPGRSFLQVSERGHVLEYQRDWSSAFGSVGTWLHHEYSKPVRGVVGNFNGSMYLVDKHGSLLVRERDADGLSWIDCTNTRNGKRVETAGPPWDNLPGRSRRFTPEEALYFVSKKGKLLQFTVAFRIFKWKDCQSPPNTEIAFIVDQESFRMNIVFVVGRDGRLYQYNRVTELWHEHDQSPHLVLSRLPGAVMRPSETSPTGSLFMILESGGLVEYHWNSAQGWKWVEHGTPNWGVRLVAAPGPCFQDGQLFLIGSDGHVYRRYLDEGTWKWASNGHPRLSLPHEQVGDKETFEGGEMDGNDKMCNEKVAAVRPIAFSEHSVVFELQDGRLAELRRSEAGAEWEWTCIIGTPNSLCPTDYMMALAF